MTVFAVLVPVAIVIVTVVLILQTLAGLNDFNMEAFRVPLGMLSALAVLASLLALSELRKLATHGLEVPSTAPFMRGAGFLAIATLFIAMIPVTGFLGTGIAMFPFAARLAGRISVLPIALGAICVPLTIYYTFGQFFSIWLPAGLVFEGLF